MNTASPTASVPPCMENAPAPALRQVRCPRCRRWLADCWGQWKGVLRVRCKRCHCNVYFMADENKVLSTD